MTTQPSTRSVLANSFQELSGSLPATIGIAIAPVGTTDVAAYGSWSSGVAWSTIKVPLAIAALRADRSRAAGPATEAITQSDNAAAEKLWSQLGQPTQAAQQVRAVIAEAGDPTTVVESRRLRPGFTAFGQTRWSLRRQAQFAAYLPCLADSAPVMALMSNLTDAQRWGIAADGAAAKGGWGPNEAGGYLVRQFGVVSTGSGQLGVAIGGSPPGRRRWNAGSRRGRTQPDDGMAGQAHIRIAGR
jgi:hypothetical protein